MLIHIKEIRCMHLNLKELFSVFKDVCPKSVLLFFAVLLCIVQCCRLKIVRFLAVFGFCCFAVFNTTLYVKYLIYLQVASN